MLTYEYLCEGCGDQFTLRQSITAAPLTECPKCQGKVHLRVSGGAGFIVKRTTGGEVGQKTGDACVMKRTGRTCCGREERCGRLPCGSRS